MVGAACSSRGFTLLEMLLVIVVLGILGVTTTQFVEMGVQMYSKSNQRSQLLDQSRFVIERLNRELRNATPNSVRVSPVQANGTQCIEFTPIVSSGLYAQAPFLPQQSNQFNYASNTSWSSFTGQLYATIYPRNNADIYSHATASATAEVTSISTTQVTLLASHSFTLRSPEQRVFIMGLPVSYCLVGNAMYRYQNYGFNTVQPLPSSGLPTGVLMAQKLVSQTGTPMFRYFPSTLTRNSIVSVLLGFSLADEGDIFLNQEVHLANAP